MPVTFSRNHLQPYVARHGANSPVHDEAIIDASTAAEADVTRMVDAAEETATVGRRNPGGSAAASTIGQDGCDGC